MTTAACTHLTWITSSSRTGALALSRRTYTQVMQEFLQGNSKIRNVQESLRPRSLPEAVDAAYGRLSVTHRRLAEHILANYDEAAFLNSRELGARVGASDSTVVRFAHALGYSGYPDLRSAMAAMMRARATDSSRMAHALRRLRRDRSPLAQVLDQDLAALSSLRSTLSTAAITEAAGLIWGARRVVAIGMGISRSLAHFAAFRLRRMGVRVETITHGGSESWEVLFGIAPRDVVLAVGFFRGYHDIVRALEYARSRGACTVVLTDTPDSPLAPHADRLMIARRGELAAVNSLVTPMALLNLLTVAVALQAPEKVTSKLGEWDLIRAAFEQGAGRNEREPRGGRMPAHDE